MLKGIIEKTGAKIFTPKRISAMADEMIVSLVGSGENEKVFRIERAQMARPEPPYGYMDTDSIVVRVFSVVNPSAQPEVKTIEAVVGSIFQHIEAIPGASGILQKYAGKIDLVSIVDAIKAFLPTSERYVLIGKNAGKTEIALVRVTVEKVEDEFGGTMNVDVHNAEFVALLVDVLPGWIEDARRSGALAL